VLHEWSHVQRRDDRAQLVQQVLHTAMGWHPAVWWLERQLALEREAACDLATVALTGSAKHYAACLATLAALPPPAVRFIPALAAASPSGLRQRVVRILSHSAGIRRWRALAFGTSVALVPIALAVGSVQVVEAVLKPAVLPATAWQAIVSAVAAPVGLIGSPTAERSTVARAPRSRPATPAAHEPGSNQQPALPHERTNTPSIAEVSSPPPEVLQIPVLAPEAPTEVPVPPSAATLEPPSLSAASIDRRPVEPATPDPAPAAGTGLAPWTAAAEAGVAIGRGSQIAGVKTAGFFSRLGKKIAGSF
jgi:hypothetical protein